jgi:ankyrin repeat protein
LHVAADRGALEIVEELVEHKAKVNVQDHYGQTPLVYAAFSGHWNVVAFLIEHHAKLNHQTKFGQTALMKVQLQRAERTARACSCL